MGVHLFYVYCLLQVALAKINTTLQLTEYHSESFVDYNDLFLLAIRNLTYTIPYTFHLRQWWNAYLQWEVCLVGFYIFCLRNIRTLYWGWPSPISSLIPALRTSICSLDHVIMNYICI